eukprot:58275-Prymnesium_polylepis.1
MAEEWLKGETKVDGCTIRCPATSQGILLTSFMFQGKEVRTGTSTRSTATRAQSSELLVRAARRWGKRAAGDDRQPREDALHEVVGSNGEDAMDEDEPASIQKYKPSEECKADKSHMQKHGTNNVGDLVFLDQSLFLGVKLPISVALFRTVNG